MIVAVAGRRIDAPDARVARFPLAAEGAVRARIAAFLKQRDARIVVAAAACGTDLIALEVAGELGLRARVVLPQGVRRFRAGSVVDRPGGWGQRFDAVCHSAKRAGDLRVWRTTGDAHRDYVRGNSLILDEAAALAAEGSTTDGSRESVVALIAWEGAPRGADDLTAAFESEAQRRAFEVVEVLTGEGRRG